VKSLLESIWYTAEKFLIHYDLPNADTMSVYIPYQVAACEARAWLNLITAHTLLPCNFTLVNLMAALLK